MPDFNSTRELWCGSGAGMASHLVCHPIDTMRTRLQTSTNPAFRRSLASCARETLRTQGLRGFYSGFSAPLAAQGVYKAIIFSVSGATRQWLADPGQRPSRTTVGIAGLLAGATNAAVVTPVELVRNRLQMQVALDAAAVAAAAASASSPGEPLPRRAAATTTRATTPYYSGAVDVIRTTVRERGVRGLFAGHTYTVARDGPGMALYFLAFETAKSALRSGGGGDGDGTDKVTGAATSSFGDVVVAACCAGVAFWTWALPIDTAKSVVQSRENQGRSPLAVAADMYAEGGARRFFRGWQAAFVRGIPGATTTLVVHAFLTKRWNNDDESSSRSESAA